MCYYWRQYNITRGWEMFDAVHIFPLAFGDYWMSHKLNEEIAIPGALGSNINSVQNGLLLRKHIHSAFDRLINYLGQLQNRLFR
jgi:hypothetical protein